MKIWIFFGLVINCMPCSDGMACPPDQKYCRHDVAFLAINLTLDKVQPAAVKEIPIILVSLAWSKIASRVPKDPKRKMCLFLTEAVGRLICVIFVQALWQQADKLQYTKFEGHCCHEAWLKIMQNSKRKTKFLPTIQFPYVSFHSI